MKVYWNTLLGNLTQAEMLPNRIKAGFKVSCCLYHTLKTWQRKFFGLGPHKRNQGKWRMVEENRWTWTSYTIRVMLWLPKIPAWMLWKLSSSLYFFFPSSYECHTWKKKMRQEKALYKGIEATFVKPRIPRRFGNYVSSWAQNFQLSKVLLNQVKGNFPAQRKAVLQGSGKKVRRLLVHQSAPGKQHVNELSEHESGTYGLNFPRNTPGVQV